MLHVLDTTILLDFIHVITMLYFRLVAYEPT